MHQLNPGCDLHLCCFLCQASRYPHRQTVEGGGRIPGILSYHVVQVIDSPELQKVDDIIYAQTLKYHKKTFFILFFYCTIVANCSFFIHAKTIFFHLFNRWVHRLSMESFVIKFLWYQKSVKFNSYDVLKIQ